MTYTLTVPAKELAAVVDCGHDADRYKDGCGTGYAIKQPGDRVCYACADDSERATMLVRGMTGEAMTAYVSGDGKNITTWSGGKLATVTSLSSSRSGFHGSEIFYVRAMQAGGRTWYGRNAGPGMAITLRPTK